MARYSKDNPHPDLEYVETKGQVVWYLCRRCGKYQNGPQHFGWRCPNCEDEHLKKQ